MRIMMCLFLLVLSTLAMADSIKCYTANGVKVLDRRAVEIYHDNEEGMFVFLERSTGKMTFTSLDCIAAVDNPLK